MRRHVTIPLCLLLLGNAARLIAQNPTRPTAADSSEMHVLRHSVDSLRDVVGTLHLKVPLDSASRARFETATTLGKGLLMWWFALVLLYLVWAVHRYVYNWGLSNREWKILYPEVFETWFDRLLGRITKSKTYKERSQELIERRRQQLGADNPAIAPAAAITKPFDEPPKNPYEGDSFGLPPGTIRGILALTSLLMFVVVEGVNLYSPASLEGQFDGLITAFEMVLAFYFGSRAVEVLQAKTQRGGAPAESAPAASEESAPASAPAQAPAPASSSPSILQTIENMLLPEGASKGRFANVIAGIGGAAAAPAAAAPNLGGMPLATRVLTMTAAFETARAYPGCFGTLAGNFDGQGLSFGALQWNIGIGSLQPLWVEMRDSHPAELKAALGGLYDGFCRMLDRPRNEQMAWALSIQSPVPNRVNTWRIADGWTNALQTLGTTKEMIAIEVKQADAFYQVALGFCRDYQLTSERGAALMFDVRVQNGSVDRNGSGPLIRADFDQIDPGLAAQDKEVARMEIIARRRAAVARADFRDDVLQRKLTIAQGTGTVHNRAYDLAKDFGIGMVPFGQRSLQTAELDRQ